MPLPNGQLRIQRVSGGRLRMDGGAMFGVVPKALWQRCCMPDDDNRIILETNCVLVRTAKHLALIDTGYGDPPDPRLRKHHALAPGHPLLANLALMGIAPPEISLVILTHLHFDHAGGAVMHDESGRVRPAFPAARYVVQRQEWLDATANRPELTGAYDASQLLPLDEAGQLQLIEGDGRIAPGIAVQLTGGHTRGHQAVILEDGPSRAIYPGDICPMTPHLRTLWTMAYDQFPLDVKRIKPQLLAAAADHDWLVLFDHDPATPAARIMRDARQGFTVRETIGL